jgi:Uma2 family endonuclease
MSVSAATSTKPGTPRRRAIRPRETDQCVVLQGIGWEGYRRVLRLRGERSRPRMIYLDGDLFLMSPGHLHERDKERFGAFVLVLAEELDSPLLMAGSTTYRRQKRKGGIEPDQSYYLANAPRVLNKAKIDLRVDPPPDLSIEVVYSHSSKVAVEVSRRFKIPEVWVCTELGLVFLVLGPDGKYVESASSLAFPFLSAAEIVDWVRLPGEEGLTDIDWVRQVRRWVRETIIPRTANRGQ